MPTTAAAQIPSSEKRGNGAPVSDRHRPPRGGRNRTPTRSRAAAKARAASAGLRPASFRPERPTKPQRRKSCRGCSKRAGNGAPVSDRHRPPERRSRPPIRKSAETNPPGLRPASVSPRVLTKPQRRRSPAAKSATMERRSPTGIAAREGRETALPPKAGTKPSGFAAISFPAVLTHRSGADPQQRKARKWSAGLRPASRPERAAKPRYPTPTDEADDHGQSCARSQRPAFTGLFRM